MATWSSGGSKTLPGGKKRPFAAIMRWSTTVQKEEPNPDGEIVRGQVLVITRLDPGGVCHVGYVDGRANPDANELARKVADEKARDIPVRQGCAGQSWQDRARLFAAHADALMHAAGAVQRTGLAMSLTNTAAITSSRAIKSLTVL